MLATHRSSCICSFCAVACSTAGTPGATLTCTIRNHANFKQAGTPTLACETSSIVPVLMARSASCAACRCCQLCKRQPRASVIHIYIVGLLLAELVDGRRAAVAHADGTILVRCQIKLQPSTPSAAHARLQAACIPTASRCVPSSPDLENHTRSCRTRPSMGGATRSLWACSPPQHRARSSVHD